MNATLWVTLRCFFAVAVLALLSPAGPARTFRYGYENATWAIVGSLVDVKLQTRNVGIWEWLFTQEPMGARPTCVYTVNLTLDLYRPYKRNLGQLVVYDDSEYGVRICGHIPKEILAGQLLWLLDYSWNHWKTADLVGASIVQIPSLSGRPIESVRRRKTFAERFAVVILSRMLNHYEGRAMRPSMLTEIDAHDLRWSIGWRAYIRALIDFASEFGEPARKFVTDVASIGGMCPPRLASAMRSADRGKAGFTDDQFRSSTARHYLRELRFDSKAMLEKSMPARDVEDHLFWLACFDDTDLRRRAADLLRKLYFVPSDVIRCPPCEN